MENCIAVNKFPAISFYTNQQTGEQMILDNERYSVVKLNSQGKEITVTMRGTFLKQVLRDGSVITWSKAV